jgi:hypothetical protein
MYELELWMYDKLEFIAIREEAITGTIESSPFLPAMSFSILQYGLLRPRTVSLSAWRMFRTKLQDQGSFGNRLLVLFMSRMLSKFGISLFLLLVLIGHASSAFSSQRLTSHAAQRSSRVAHRKRSFNRNPPLSSSEPDLRICLSGTNDSEPAKFGLKQRVESIKCLAIAGLSGSVAMAPVSALRNAVLSGSLSQWEFDTDMGSLEAGLFGIVYRYCIREDENSQLSSGCVGAFAIVRTLSRIETSTSCSAIPLACKCCTEQWPLGNVDALLAFAILLMLGFAPASFVLRMA